MFAFMVAGLLWSARVAPPCLLGPLPDRVCSPGATVDIHVPILCSTSTKDRRHVSASTRKAVLSEYGIAWSDRALWRVDHVIPLGLAGADAIENMAPQTVQAAATKDVYEDRARRLVCSGRMSLANAQAAFLGDWTQSLP